MLGSVISVEVRNALDTSARPMMRSQFGLSGGIAKGGWNGSRSHKATKRQPKAAAGSIRVDVTTMPYKVPVYVRSS
jgi:hypothetical protein